MTMKDQIALTIICCLLAGVIGMAVGAYFQDGYVREEICNKINYLHEEIMNGVEHIARPLKQKQGAIYGVNHVKFRICDEDYRG